MYRIALALLLILPLGATAQQYNFINYGIADGLAASQTRSITQDSKGYLWIGTHGGVTRFDGINFTIFSVEDGLIDNRTDVVFSDSKDQIWLGSKGGICRFDNDTFQQFLFDETRSENFVLAIAEAPNGDLWIGTEGAGAARFDGKKFEYYDESNNLISNAVRTVFVDEDETVWLGAVGGVSQWKNGKITKHQIPELEGRNIANIFRDSKGQLWVGTATVGLFGYLGDERIHFMQHSGLISDNVEHIFEDSNGSLWISSLQGLTKYENGQFTTFDNAQGLRNTRLKSVSEDNEGNLWIASDLSGIYKFSGEAFVNYSLNDGICSDFVMSVTEDLNGNIWFSTYDKGVCMKDGNTFTNYNTDNGLASNKVWCSLTASDSSIWFGTSSGISIIRNGVIENIHQLDNELPDYKITALFQESNGNIWIGTREGVSVWDGDSLTNYTQAQGFPGLRIYNIHKDSEGRFWFACANGLVLKKGNTFQPIVASEALKNNKVHSIIEDNDHNLWFGTSNGLTHFDGKTYTDHRMARHFSSNHVNFLEFDVKNRLWIGTNNGLFRLNLNSYYTDHTTDFKLFTDLDGIRSLETNLNAAYKDSKGNLWMGTSMGTVRFDPAKEKIFSENEEPYISLSEIRLFLERTKWENYSDEISREGLPQNLVLRHNKNYLTFYYRGISHTNPQKVLYQFWLEGFEETWKPVTSATFATYSNLPYGSYTFRVKASNKDGVWNSIPAEFSFEIARPFWLTWWFYLLGFMLLVLIGYAIYKRQKKNSTQQREREQLINRSKMMALEQQTLNSSMNRHFIFNALNSIQYYINREDKLAANKYLSSFARLVRKNLDSSQTNVVSLSDELERLELYLGLEHMRFSNKFEYEITVAPEIDTESVLIPAMLLQPFVENSIWHGLLPMESGGKITLNISKKEDRLYIIIDDNGIGINTSLKQKGHPKDHISQGMSITTGRLRLLKEMTNETLYVKGPYELIDDNQVVTGTRVEIVLPYDYAAVMPEIVEE